MSIVESQKKLINPIALASFLQNSVCKGSSARYTDFLCTGPRGGLSTGFIAGCCLQCAFCYIDDSRDHPEKYGKFYTPDEALEEMLKKANIKGVKRLKLSGGEPTLCYEHLFKILESIQDKDIILTLETNGILLGYNREYVNLLSKYNQFHIRISLKAGTPKSFSKITGAEEEFFELPFDAIKFLISTKMSFHVSAMTDQRIMPPEDKILLIEKLRAIGYKDFIEEETLSIYPITIARLKNAGIVFLQEKYTD